MDLVSWGSAWQHHASLCLVLSLPPLTSNHTWALRGWTGTTGGLNKELLLSCPCLSVAVHSWFLQPHCNVWNTGSHNSCFQYLCPVTSTSFYQAKERINVMLHMAATYSFYGCEWVCNIWLSPVCTSISVVVIKPEDKAEARGGPSIASNCTWEWDMIPVK